MKLRSSEAHIFKSNVCSVECPKAVANPSFVCSEGASLVSWVQDLHQFQFYVGLAQIFSLLPGQSYVVLNVEWKTSYFLLNWTVYSSQKEVLVGTFEVASYQMILWKHNFE